MGHREDLLAGAKKCLLEIGFAKTTARDIVAASGTNLASIGYHFGSKDALMTEAMVELMGDWGEKFNAVGADGASYSERFTATWRSVIKAILEDRKLALASFENFSLSARDPALGTIVGDAQEEARSSFGEDFLLAGEPADAATQRAVGGLMLAVTTGLIAQWLLDPKRAPKAEDLTRAFAYVSKAFAAAEPAKKPKRKPAA